MRCNILRRPAFPGGNLKEKQFHIKLSDTVQVCGVEGEGREIERSVHVCVCVNGWRTGGMRAAGIFRSFLTCHWPTGARHTHPLRRVKRDGVDEISKPPLQTHALLCTHQHWDVQIFDSVVPAWFPLPYASISHGSAVINEKAKLKENGSTCMCVRARENSFKTSKSQKPFFFP